MVNDCDKQVLRLLSPETRTDVFTCLSGTISFYGSLEHVTLEYSIGPIITYNVEKRIMMTVYI